MEQREPEISELRFGNEDADFIEGKQFRLAGTDLDVRMPPPEGWIFSSRFEHLPDGSVSITDGYRDKDGSWVESSRVVPSDRVVQPEKG